MLIAVEGLGSMNNSNGMYSFISKGFSSGFSEVFIDLESCDGMDSTFMGTLLLIHEEAVQAGGGLVLANVSPYNVSKLEELGVAHFLKMSKAPISEDIIFEPLPASGGSSGRMSLVLRAHEELVEKNEANAKVFESFINALKGSLPS